MATRLSVYDPFAEVFPELFRGILQPAQRGGSNGANDALEIKLDVKETDAAYAVHAEMPGVKKEDIQVQINGNRVAISAEVKRENEKKDGERVLRSERYFGSIARSFTLASEIDDAKAEATFEDGVLALTLPKKSAPASTKLQIK